MNGMRNWYSRKKIEDIRRNIAECKGCKDFMQEFIVEEFTSGRHIFQRRKKYNNSR